MKMQSLLLALFFGVYTSPVSAKELQITMKYLGFSRSSTFVPQLWVRTTNDSFTSMPLAEKIQASQLIVDGRSMKRKDIPFRGPVGLPIQGSWEGCLPLEDYIDEGLPDGNHRIQLILGTTKSEAVTIRTRKRELPAVSPKERRHQVEALQNVITPGLLRSCVENWLTEQDGGLQSPGIVRYYVDPGVKVVVSYSMEQSEPVVKGRLKIYLESRIED